MKLSDFYISLEESFKHYTVKHKHSGKTYKVTYEVSDYVSGEVRCILGGFTLGQITSSNGLVTEYLTVSNASSNTFVYLETRGSGFTGSIDNVSVKQVDPNDRWTLSSGFSFSSNGLHCTSDGTYEYASQANVFVIGKTYKLTFQVVDYTSEYQRIEDYIIKEAESGNEEAYRVMLRYGLY